MKFKTVKPYLIGATALLMGLSHLKTTTATANNSSESEYHPTDFFLYLDSVYTDIQPLDLTPYPVNVKAHQNNVVYVLSNKDTLVRSGGTRAWRNMNPGCLRYGNFARENGAIGKCGGFAVFPDEQTGRAALAQLLKTDSYRNLTIHRAISKYAPPFQNDVAGYRRKLQRLTGLSLNTKLCELDSVQLDKVVSAISTIEGWREGTEKYIEAPENKLIAQNPATLPMLAAGARTR